MLQIREIRLSGLNVEDASVEFRPGPNVIAGESDTGKSYLLHCLDYIFGAEELKKRIPQADPYDELKVEFQSSAGDYLTLVRSLSGGDLKAHRSEIDAIDEDGEPIVYSKRPLTATLTGPAIPFGRADQAWRSIFQGSSSSIRLTG